MPYDAALALMRGVAPRVRTGEHPPLLILTEHPPTLTLGRRAGEEELAATPGELAARGLAVHRIERGGLATAHGPGQLVAYPVLHLPSLGLGVRTLVERLEAAVIAVAGDYGLPAGRREGHPGVWVGERKLASLGLAVKRGVSLHGLALNYGPDLWYFDAIRPCGLDREAITSLALLLGREMAAAEVKAKLAQRLGEALGVVWRREAAR